MRGSSSPWRAARRPTAANGGRCHCWRIGGGVGLVEAVWAQALRQLPPTGKVRLAVDWTIEGSQHLLVISLVTGGRAVPIYWRAYDATVLKGRMRRYETAVIRRAITRAQRAIGQRRVIVTADRGFADVALVDGLTELGVEFVIRVNSSPAARVTRLRSFSPWGKSMRSTACTGAIVRGDRT